MARTRTTWKAGKSGKRRDIPIPSISDIAMAGWTEETPASPKQLVRLSSGTNLGAIWGMSVKTPLAA
jgi:hypothetical protein